MTVSRSPVPPLSVEIIFLCNTTNKKIGYPVEHGTLKMANRINKMLAVKCGCYLFSIQNKNYEQ